MIHSFLLSFFSSWKIFQGICPGLTHGQKYGISYVDLIDTAQEDKSTHQSENAAKSHSPRVVSDQTAGSSLSNNNDRGGNVHESSERGSEWSISKIYKSLIVEAAAK